MLLHLFGIMHNGTYIILMVGMFAFAFWFWEKGSYVRRLFIFREFHWNRTSHNKFTFTHIRDFEWFQVVIIIVPSIFQKSQLWCLVLHYKQFSKKLWGEYPDNILCNSKFKICFQQSKLFMLTIYSERKVAILQIDLEGKRHDKHFPLPVV